MTATLSLPQKEVKAAWRRFTKRKGVGDVQGTVADVAVSTPAGQGKEGSDKHASTREPVQQTASGRTGKRSWNHVS